MVHIYIPSLISSPFLLFHPSCPQPHTSHAPSSQTHTLIENLVPIRLRDQNTALARLDEQYEQTHHPLLDRDRMVGKGGVEAQDGEDELQSKEARRVLDEHTRDRLGFVRLAGERLQAVLGEKNTWTFGELCLPP